MITNVDPLVGTETHVFVHNFCPQKVSYNKSYILINNNHNYTINVLKLTLVSQKNK